MPELPEVETVRTSLEPVLVGRRLARVEIADARLTRPFDPVAVARGLEDERVAAVARRGKYLIVRFESGRALLAHLRMTGSFRHVRGSSPPDDPHARALVTLDDGTTLVYRDVRRFGTWLVLDEAELGTYLAARLGAEPLERAFGPKELERRLAGRRAPLKAALLDQRTVAGVGNIYVDEALWRARLHPLTPAQEVDAESIRRLHKAIRDALRTGIRRQGATLRDYAQPDGTRGSMQDAFAVYGREGEPCGRCGTPIEKTRAGGRGTWYCPRCQPLEPGYAARSSSASSRPSRSSRHSSV